MHAPFREPLRALLFDLDDTLWPITPVIERAETLMFDWLQAQVPQVTERYTIASMRARRIELMASHPRFRVDLWALRHAALTEAFLACGADTAHIDGAMALFDQFLDAENGVARLQFFPQEERARLGIGIGAVEAEEIGKAGDSDAEIGPPAILAP